MFTRTSQISSQFTRGEASGIDFSDGGLFFRDILKLPDVGFPNENRALSVVDNYIRNERNNAGREESLASARAHSRARSQSRNRISLSEFLVLCLARYPERK